VFSQVESSPAKPLWLYCDGGTDLSRLMIIKLKFIDKGQCLIKLLVPVAVSIQLVTIEKETA
jgi:hypothetical protein